MPETSKKPYWVDGVAAFSRMSGWIIGPVLLGLVVGKLLDAHYHSSPRAVLICIIGAFILSFVGLIKEAMKYLKTIPPPPEKTDSTNTAESISHTTEDISSHE